MAGILYDARRIKAYEKYNYIGQLVGLDVQFCENLWSELICDTELFDEMIYYLENHSLLGNAKCREYSMIDMYVWQMDRYNIIGDSGKNTEICNKDRMVLLAFNDMVQMKKNPDEYIKKMTSGRGKDKL